MHLTYVHASIPGHFFTSIPVPSGSQCWGVWGSFFCFLAISKLHPESKFPPISPFPQAMQAGRFGRQLQPQLQAWTDLQGK